MVYHFFPQGIYANQFIDFMRKNTDKLYNEHKFLFLSYGETEPNKIFDSKDCANVYSFFSILKIFLFAKKDDRFIIHNYTHPYLYLSTACMCWKLKKVAWIIWGGDLYWHNSPKKKIKHKCYEILKQLTIKNFGYICTCDAMEFNLAKEYYGAEGKNYHIQYPLSFIDFPNIKVKNYLAVLLGNSRDTQNNHIEALEFLSKFKDENIKIYVPLSYGDCPDGYVESVDKKGKSLFANKYIAIKDMMDLKSYQEFLSKIDIMVCNHNRQQALGNLFLFLKNKKKIFIRTRIATENYFNTKGLKFFLTDDIENMSFEEFKYFSQQDGELNESIITKMFSDETLVEQWNNFFINLTRLT
ncbi:MAG: TDP-N-acetylfucosamine:lipid II N-acetylfucosaminyltransferase [Treponema phagedenis]|uniref:TDP-N-acetylfucosamine:lipid II N-acetylfucosaminyltransferase n=1 Tax=Treponema phagedenis TaxID=162 RepID=UPI00313404D5